MKDKLLKQRTRGLHIGEAAEASVRMMRHLLLQDIAGKSLRPN